MRPWPAMNHLTDGGSFSKCFQIRYVLRHILLKLFTRESIDNVLKERIVDRITVEIELHKDFIDALSFGYYGEIFLQEHGVLCFDLGWKENEGVRKSLEVYLFLFQFH